jgi:hypothetical protein
MVVGPSHVLPASAEKQQPIFSRDQAPDLKHFPTKKMQETNRSKKHA